MRADRGGIRGEGRCGRSHQRAEVCSIEVGPTTAFIFHLSPYDTRYVRHSYVEHW